MSVTPISPIQAALTLDSASIAQGPLAALQPPGSVSFGQMLVNGLEGTNKKLLNADNMVRAFTLDDSVPVHQVMFALDQARASMELALQVRTRLLDGYQQLMNMQL